MFPQDCQLWLHEEEWKVWYWGSSKWTIAAFSDCDAGYNSSVHNPSFTLKWFSSKHFSLFICLLVTSINAIHTDIRTPVVKLLRRGYDGWSSPGNQQLSSWNCRKSRVSGLLASASSHDNLGSQQQPKKTTKRWSTSTIDMMCFALILVLPSEIMLSKLVVVEFIQERSHYSIKNRKSK